MSSWSSGRVVALAVVALSLPDVSAAQASTGTLAGEVGDAATGAPIGEVRVTASSPALAAPRSAVTDREGRFSLGTLPPGIYRLEATAEGYLAEARDGLEAKPATTLRVRLVLTPDTVVAEEVVVTGTRLKRLDLLTPAPVTVVSREQFQASGVISLGEFLQALPEQTGGMSRQVNNGGDGTSQVNLRGLGAYRTLVLINGRRTVAAGTGANVAVDFNTIPAAAVERVEILKDGASPVYGSEAIGGVVNVITRRRWTGTEATVYTGGSTRLDGGTLDASLTLGQAGDAGSVLFSVGFAQQGTAWAEDRTYSQYAWGYDMTGANSPGGEIGPYRNGSPNVPAGRVNLPAGEAGTALYQQLLATNPDTTQFFLDPAAPLGWSPSYFPQQFVLPEDGGNGYNYQPANYLLTPSRRLSLFSTGEARLGSQARAFYEASFVGLSSQQKLAPDPFSTLESQTVVSASNAYNPFGVDVTRLQRRLVEMPNRAFTQDTAFARVVGGLGGSLSPESGPMGGWDWEFSFVFGESQGTEAKQGYLRRSKIQDAVGPSFNAGTADQPDWRCGADAGHEIVGCVPLDLFHGPGSITQAQLQGLTFDGTARGTNRVAMAQASATGPLFRLASTQPVALALGYDYRKVDGSYVPDPITASLDVDTDLAISSLSGSQAAHEAYAELAIPILSEAPLAESLELTASARAFRYDGFEADWTWKLGGRWTPLRGVTLRGTMSTAYRAPTLWELGSESTGTNTLGRYASDPCSGVDHLDRPIPISPSCPPGPSPDPRPAFTSIVKGNPSLDPERARIFTTGIVLEPAFLPELTVTADFWGVEVTSTPTVLAPTYYLNACYPAAGGPVPSFCASAIQRSLATNDLTQVTAAFVNSGAEWMRGLDLALQYRHATPIGRFGLTFLGTWLERHDFTVPPGSTFFGAPVPDGTLLRTAGTGDHPTGQMGVFPRYRFNAGLTWALDRLSAGASVRYVGGFKLCGSPDTLGADGSTRPGGDMGAGLCSLDSTYSMHVPDHATWDAFVGHGFKTSAGQTELSLGVQNLLDQAPPTIYGNLAYGSDPTAYDFLGRFVYLRVTQRL